MLVTGGVEGSLCVHILALLVMDFVCVCVVACDVCSVCGGMCVVQCAFGVV